MILQALYELAEHEQLVGDPDYELKPVAWLVHVDSGGRLLGIVGTHHVPENGGRRRPRPVPKSIRVPRQQGRSGTKAPPNFLVDNAKYVFGLPTADKPFSEEEGAEKSGWFREAVAACAAATGDEGVRAVLALLEDVAAGRQRITLPEGCVSNEQFAFVFAPDVDLPVHERPAVQAYWRALRRRQEDGSGADGGDSQRCLVTGRRVRAVPLFPLVKKVPGGASAGAALVSFNQRAFESHGWGGNENAPISRGAAEACATALNRLLDPEFPDPRPGREGEKLPPRVLRLGDDTAVCFWSPEPAAQPFLNEFAALFGADDAAAVGELYRSIWRGRPVQLDEPGRFYALTLSGAQGRVIVRDWLETSVAEVAANLARHFADLAVVRNAPSRGEDGAMPHVALGFLLASLAPRGKREEIPAPLAADFIRAALRGAPYPIALLQRALERMRAEIGDTEWADLVRRDARIALIKAVLARTFHSEVTPAMDPTNRNPGYLLGRLMAVIERLQQVALGDVNAGVVDRYFASASATPRAVFTRLLRNARHHARKAKDAPSIAGVAQWLESQIDEIAGAFDPAHDGFPAHLDLVQQGLFVLGYHHQRHWLWLSREEREALAAGAPASN